MAQRGSLQGDDVSDLSSDEKQTLSDWFDKLDEKYRRVGRLAETTGGGEADRPESADNVKKKKEFSGKGEMGWPWG